MTTEPTSEVIQDNENGDTFQESTGFSRFHASRVAAAVLNVIGSSAQDNITRSQQLNAAMNVLGFAISEVIAATGANAEQRADMRKSYAAFVEQTSEEVAKHLEGVNAITTYTLDTANGKVNEATGEPLQAN